MTANSTAEVIFKLLAMLSNNKVNKEHTLTTAESQAKHKRTDITKISKRKLIPAKAFWAIYLIGDDDKNTQLSDDETTPCNGVFDTSYVTVCFCFTAFSIAMFGFCRTYIFVYFVYWV